ncbi:MAG: hypothetical protein Q8P31_07740 [Bacillota bacterium]|nr:hypothetical protein [Bacillota bacterium]
MAASAPSGVRRIARGLRAAARKLRVLAGILLGTAALVLWPSLLTLAAVGLAVFVLASPRVTRWR